MTRPRTRYARSGDVSIAYQVIGDGPLDLVVVPGWISNVDFAWEDPLYGEWTAASRLQPGHRVRQARHRAVGPGRRRLPRSRIAWTTCARCSRRPGPSARQCSASRRVALCRSSSRPPTRSGSRGSSSTRRSPGRAGLPTTRKGTWRNRVSSALQHALETAWGEGTTLDVMVPALAGEQRSREFMGRYERMCVSPRAGVAHLRWLLDLDVRPVARALPGAGAGSPPHGRPVDPGRGRACPGARHSRCALRGAARRRPPALGGRQRGAGGRDPAVPHRLAGAGRRRPRARHGALHRHRQLDGARCGPRRSRLARAARPASRRRPPGDRAASRSGAERQRRRLPRHVRRAGARHPVRARPSRRRCATSGSTSAPACTPASASCAASDIAGIAVNTGARVMAKAGPGEVLVSSTVKDLVAGSVWSSVTVARTCSRAFPASGASSPSHDLATTRLRAARGVRPRRVPRSRRRRARATLPAGRRGPPARVECGTDCGQPGALRAAPDGSATSWLRLVAAEENR